MDISDTVDWVHAGRAHHLGPTGLDDDVDGADTDYHLFNTSTGAYATVLYFPSLVITQIIRILYN